MKLDGEITNGWAGIALVAGYLLMMLRFAPRRPKQYNRPDKVAIGTPFNLFDSTRWTEEGVEYNKRSLQFGCVVFLALGALWLVLDIIW